MGVPNLGNRFCSGSNNRCVLIDQKTSKSSERIASATAGVTLPAHHTDTKATSWPRS